MSLVSITVLITILIGHLTILCLCCCNPEQLKVNSNLKQLAKERLIIKDIDKNFLNSYYFLSRKFNGI